MIVLQKGHSSRKYGGTHGVCILVKQSLPCNICVLPKMTSNDVLWVKISSTVLGSECVIGSIYIPGELYPFADANAFDYLGEDLMLLKRKEYNNICFIGDFNSRTRTLEESVEIEEVINRTNHLPCTNTVVDQTYRDETGFVKRVNKDANTNNYGHKLVELCQAADMRLINGRIGKGKDVGALTCHKGSGSTIDYLIVSASFVPLVYNFRVDTQDKYLSDEHCPLVTELRSQQEEMQMEIYKQARTNLNEGTPLNVMSFIWNGDLAGRFRIGMETQYVDVLIGKLDDFKLSPNKAKMDELCNDLRNMYIDMAKSVGIYKTKNRKGRNYDVGCKPWFDKEFEEKRKIYVNIKNRYRRLRERDGNMDADEFRKECTKYKNFIRAKARKYHAKLNENLRSCQR